MHKFEQNCFSGFDVQHAQRNTIILLKSFFPPKQNKKSKKWRLELEYKFEVFMQIFEHF